MTALEQLDKKLTLLLKKHAALETENKRLKATIATRDAAISELNRQLKSMDDSMSGVRLAATVTDEKEKEYMRSQLDNVIQEIDKILNTLND